MPFIVTGTCNGIEYYLKWEMAYGHRPEWSWQGLMDNATKWDDFDEALFVQGRMMEEGELPCVVVEL